MERTPEIRKRSVAVKLAAIREKRERGEKLTKKEQQILAYASPAGCPSCYSVVRVSK